MAVAQQLECQAIVSSNPNGGMRFSFGFLANFTSVQFGVPLIRSERRNTSAYDVKDKNNRFMPELLLVKRLYEHKIGLQNDEVLPGQDIAVDRLHRPSSHLLRHG